MAQQWPPSRRKSIQPGVYRQFGTNESEVNVQPLRISLVKNVRTDMSEQSSTASGDISDPSPPASSTATRSRHEPVFHPTASRLASITLRSTTAIDPADRRKFRALYLDARAVLRRWSLDRINMELLERGLPTADPSS